MEDINVEVEVILRRKDIVKIFGTAVLANMVGFVALSSGMTLVEIWKERKAEEAEQNDDDA